MVVKNARYRKGLHEDKPKYNWVNTTRVEDLDEAQLSPKRKVRKGATLRTSKGERDRERGRGWDIKDAGCRGVQRI